jgi:hypothetical protein
VCTADSFGSFLVRSAQRPVLCRPVTVWLLISGRSVSEPHLAAATGIHDIDLSIIVSFTGKSYLAIHPGKRRINTVTNLIAIPIKRATRAGVGERIRMEPNNANKPKFTSLCFIKVRKIQKIKRTHSIFDKVWAELKEGSLIRSEYSVMTSVDLCHLEGITNI